jgi:hypothetical protein
MFSFDSSEERSEDQRPATITQSKVITEYVMKKNHSNASELARKIAKRIKHSHFKRKLLRKLGTIGP